MSTATLPDLVDFAWQHPAPSQLRDLGLDGAGYTGSARVDAAWLSELLGYGRRLLMIQETYSTRSQEGFAAGAADSGFAESRADEIGYALDMPIAVVVSDGNGGDGWDSGDYARGWASVARRKFFPYGALGVTNTFNAGAAASGSVLWVDGEWVPITWGNGRLIQQLVQEPPIPGTDMNTVVGDWTGGGGSAATPRHHIEEDVLYKTTDNGTDTYYRDAGGVLVPLDPGTAAAFYPLVVDGTIPVVNLGGGLGAVGFTIASIQAQQKAAGIPAAPAGPTDAQKAAVKGLVDAANALQAAFA